LLEEEALDSEAIYAEIVYLPEGRIGNVLCRPVLRAYEIVYLGRSGAPIDRQLPADDLLVGMRDGKFILYSQRLRRRVIPRMSNAHGYSRPGLSPLYRFLCDLQNQGGMRVPYFSWGALAKLDALPRVRIGRVVLACAQWRISSAESKSISDSDRYAAFQKVKKMQRERGLPRWVVLAQGDNVLPVDLDNPLSVDSLLHLLNRSPEAVLVEMYPQHKHQCATGPEGYYEHELVVPLTNSRSIPKEHSTMPTPLSGYIRHIDSTYSVKRTERLLPPGSQWHFVKIYGGSSSLDDLLKGELAPLLSSPSTEDILECWFFVRYSDPETHLRLRFQTKDNTISCDLTRTLEDLLARGKLWNIQYDTYRREIERYGGLEGTLASEEIFCADSEAVLAIIVALDSDRQDVRWRVALLGIDSLLTDCGLNIDDKVHLMGNLRNLFASEFHLSPLNKQKLGERFRHERASIQAMMRREPTEQKPIYDIAFQAFTRRSERIRPAIRRLRALQQNETLANDFFDIVASYVHMHVNRIIRSSPRGHELVLYDFLYRVYESDRAREKRATFH